MIEFRQYFYFLTGKLNDKKEIVTEKIKFYLDEQDCWEDQLNLITTDQSVKQRFWKSVEQALDEKL